MSSYDDYEPHVALNAGEWEDQEAHDALEAELEAPHPGRFHERGGMADEVATSIAVVGSGLIRSKTASERSTSPTADLPDHHTNPARESARRTTPGLGVRPHRSRLKFSSSGSGRCG
jgi:hypothetical protein